MENQNQGSQLSYQLKLRYIDWNSKGKIMSQFDRTPTSLWRFLPRSAYCGWVASSQFISTLLLCFWLFPTNVALSQVIKATTSEAKAFVKADKNKDIRLTPSEFRVFVRAMAANGQSTAKTIRFFSAYKMAFSIADKNKDGFVSPQEMRASENKFRKSNWILCFANPCRRICGYSIWRNVTGEALPSDQIEEIELAVWTLDHLRSRYLIVTYMWRPATWWTSSSASYALPAANAANTETREKAKTDSKILLNIWSPPIGLFRFASVAEHPLNTRKHCLSDD